MVNEPRPGLPFAHLNLRLNPFGEATPADRAVLAVVMPLSLERRIVQIIGDCGRGKTTHLLAFQAQYPGSIYRRLEPDEHRYPRSIPDDGVFLLDEAQQLRGPDLRRLLRRSGPVVLGTHHDLSSVAGRPLFTIRLGGLDVSRLGAIVSRRIEWARRDAGAVPFVSDAALAGLICRFGDDVRAIESALYDAVQTMKEPGHVEV